MSTSPPTFSHTGYRYLLGYDDANYGIWDRNAPGSPPIQTFPRSDDGWSAAWSRYLEMEPGNTPIAGAPPTPPTPPTPQASPVSPSSTVAPPTTPSMSPTPPPVPQFPASIPPPVYGYATPAPTSSTGTRVLIGIAIAVGVILVVGILMAIALPTFLGAQARAQDKAAESNIDNAVAAAKTYYTDSHSYAGFTWIQAKQIEPSLIWNESPVALVNQVSVRGVSKQSVVLVTKSESGHIFCFATGTLGDAMGTTDASAAGECAGGWPI